VFKKPVPPHPEGAFFIWTTSNLVWFDGKTLGMESHTSGNRSKDTYSISQISGVSVQPPQALQMMGRFQVVLAGGLQHRRNQTFASATFDPLTVTFNKKWLRHFDVLAKRIRDAQAALVVPALAAVPVAPVQSLGDQLSQLAALHAQGVLSEAEFAAAKARLLGPAEPGPQDQPPTGQW
jgi:Short C-terminal domain